MSLRVTLVNYINTYPFLDALLKHPDRYQIIKKNPKACGLDFIDLKTDIALVPTGFLLSLRTAYKLLADYGIASNGQVRTVKLLSNKPINEIKSISLDSHSTTSCLLLKILCQHYWKIKVEYKNANFDNYTEVDSALMIGDKVFEHEDGFEFHYDLGECWTELTGLPFVYAIWLARDNITEQELLQFNKDLDAGFQMIDQTISNHRSDVEKIDLGLYLTENIKFKLSESYIQGLEKFIELSESLELNSTLAT